MLIKIKPLSINKAFQGRRFHTKEHKQYIEDMLWLLKGYKGLKTKELYKIDIIFTFKNKASDISNCIKIFEDCLVKSGIVRDDRDCYEMTLHKKIGKDESITFNIENYDKSKQK